MAQFALKTMKVNEILVTEGELIRKLEEIEQNILNVADNLGFTQASNVAVRKSLVAISQKVDQHKNGMGMMRDSLYGAIDFYERTEKSICEYADGIGSQVSGSVLSGLGAVTVTGLNENLQGNGIQNENFQSGTVQSSGSGNRTESGAERYCLPEYALQGLEPEKGIYGPFLHHRDGSLGRVCEWNDKARTELSCTYYTLRKLNERGLGYPCVAGPGNGNNWFRNFDTESKLPRYEGNDALRILSGDNLHTLPQENIVVSFASNPSSDYEIKQCGHVLLIDKIYRNEQGEVMVQWSDNWPKIGSLNGSNVTQDLPLEQFMTKYNRSNGAINGAVIIGAGNASA